MTFPGGVETMTGLRAQLVAGIEKSRPRKIDILLNIDFSSNERASEYRGEAGVVMAAIFDRRIDHPSAWTSAQIGGKQGLVRALSERELAALLRMNAGLAGRAPESTVRADWDDPAIAGLMGELRAEVMDGKGAVILSGLPMDQLGVEDFSRIYWGLGTHLGQAAPQSYQRDLIGHVHKAEHNPTGRGYLMDIELFPHTDFHEVLSLAGVRPSAEGGVSGLVSSLAIHNAMLEEAPGHLETLYEGYFHELAGGEQVSPEKVPVFCNVDGMVSCYFHVLFQMGAAKKRGEEIPADLMAAQQCFAGIAARPEVKAEFMLEPGEMLFWHNFQMLHARSAFHDSDEQKRLLLRLWLNVEGGRPMHPAFRERARAMDRLHQAGEAAIHYIKSGVLEHIADLR
jgi:hypothetical protein